MLEEKKQAVEEAGARKDFGPRYRVAPLVYLLVAAVALAVLIPFREAFASVPVVPFLSALILFAIPGYVLTAFLSEEGLLVRLPTALALSAGAFALLALPVLVLHASMGVYLALCGGLVAASLVLAAVLPGLRGAPVLGKGARLLPQREDGGILGDVLLVFLVFLAGVLALISTTRAPAPGEDVWVYLGYAREFLSSERLGAVQPFSDKELKGLYRVAANGWVLVESALARLSGTEPVTFFLNYLAPALVVASVLAFVGLAKALMRSAPAALFAGVLYALYLLATVRFSPTSPGGEIVGRAFEDKFVVRYLLLPAAVLLLALYLRERRWSLLALFALACYGATAVHVIGAILIGIVFTGFAAVHLAFGPRRRRTWTDLLFPGVVLGSIVALPAAYYLATTGGLPSVLESADPSRAAYRLYAWERQERLLVLGENSYIMHPALLREPVVIGGYLLGVPLLVRQARESVAARLLLGTMILSPILLYVPPVATLIGRVIGPWTLWRLSWPMLLASSLACAMVLWWAFGLLGDFAGRRSETRAGRVLGGFAAILPLAFVVALAVAATPLALRGARAVETEGEIPQNHSDCFDPALAALGEGLEGPTRVLAPDNESSCLPAWSAPISIVSFRGLAVLNNEGAIAESSGSEVEATGSARRIKDFYEADVVDREILKTLRSRRVERVLLPVGSQLVAQLDHMPAFERLDTPGGRYVAYDVDLGKLERDRLVLANSLLVEEEYEKAARIYANAPSRGQDDDFIALLGRGRAFARLERYPNAVANLEAAVELDPGSVVARSLLAEARNAQGDAAGARKAYSEALERNPRNMQLRLDYGLMLLVSDVAASIEQHREVVQRHPEVPEYRIKLGGALALIGRPEEADAELAKAVELDPLSAQTHSDLGRIYDSTSRFEEAARYYERALELDPQSQTYAYRLGVSLARFSAQNPGDDALFERAEEALLRVEDLEPYPWEADNEAEARIALGDLYASRGRTDDARAAYEEAQRVDPDSGAGEKLEGLEGR